MFFNDFYSSVCLPNSTSYGFSVCVCVCVCVVCLCVSLVLLVASVLAVDIFSLEKSDAWRCYLPKCNTDINKSFLREPPICTLWMPLYRGFVKMILILFEIHAMTQNSEYNSQHMNYEMVCFLLSI